MRRSYGSIQEKDAATMKLGKEIVDLLIKADVPYIKAYEAQDAAADILDTDTKPINVSPLPQGD